MTSCNIIGNEHESSPPLSLDHYFKIVVYDGYVKYEDAEIHSSAIMQDFRNSGKKIINDKKQEEKKMADLQPFWIF